MSRAWLAMMAALLTAALSGCCCGPCGRPCVCSLGCGEWYWGDWFEYGEPCDACGNWVGGPAAAPWDGHAGYGPGGGGFCAHCGRGFTAYGQPYQAVPADEPAYSDDGYGPLDNEGNTSAPRGTPAEFGLHGVQDFRVISDRPVTEGEPTPADTPEPRELKGN
jgi:hypothetical protein